MELAFCLNFASCDERLNRQFFDGVQFIVKQRLWQAMQQDGPDQIALARLADDGCPHCHDGGGH